MPELLTAWVTLAATTRGMESDIRRAITRASGSARIDPKVNTAGLSSQGSKAGKEFGDKFSSSAKDALKAISALTIGVGLVDQFKKVLDVGLEWTNSLNTLQAVTGATSDQLKAAGAAARALGNDISLPATSANDAAAAMTELAKGGFTVQQSMDAAKGSLQLAAAAQIGAADAATIQSQALQAFGLQASDAGKIADTLANAANASSAEITDVAQALAQAGTVANQFGLSAQDTAAAIALLANNGIKGSDAGTLLKSSLLALTDQGNPAQGAIKQLGLTVYDTQGKFVGLHELFRQLGDASKSMTPEMYQAATATLFGSDAMRLAGVAAKDGSAGYDSMRTSIDRQGAAADVAAAKTKGLPGAWERVKNALKSLQLNTYDAIEGPLTKAADIGSAALGKIPDAFKQLAANPAIQTALKDTGDVFKSLGATVKGMGPSLLEIVKSLGTAAGTLGVVAWKALVTALQAASGALQIVSPLISGIGNVMRDNQAVVTALAGAWLAFKVVPGIVGKVSDALNPLKTRAIGARDAIKGFAEQMQLQKQLGASSGQSISNLSAAFATIEARTPALNRMAGAYRDASTSASRFSRVQGTAASGMSLLKSGASGIIGALGGPFTAALFGAGAAFTAIESQNAQATQAMEGYRDAAKQASDAQTTLNDSLIRSAGLFDDQAKADAANRLKTVKDDLTAHGKSDASPLDQFRDKTGSLLGGFSSQIFDFSGANTNNNLKFKKDQEADVSTQAAAALDKLKLSNETLSQQVTGAQPVFDALVQNLQAQGTGGVVAAEKIKALRTEILGAQQAGATANPVLKALGDDVVQSAANIRTAFSAVPTDKPINVSAPGGQAVFDLLSQLGQKVSQDNAKNIHVDAPLAPDVLNTLKSLGFEVTQNNDKTISVHTAGTDQALANINQVKGALSGISGQVSVNMADVGSPTNVPRHLFGAVVMANGGFTQIRKPGSADIYAGRGAGTIFAEQETGGEAYIPLAAAKRSRSKRILSEVARLFGMNVMADGAITIDALKEFASGISGGGYVRGGPPGLSGTDCSGAQADIANFITGGSGRFSTATEAQALLSRGFQTGDPPAGVSAYWVGWKNGGPGGGHTAGTIVDPLGGNVNVEMGGSSGGGSFGGGAAGAAGFPNRAWIQIAGGEDPNAPTSFGGSSAAVQSATASVTSSKASVTSAQASLDQATAAVADAKAKGQSADKVAIAEKKRDAAQTKLDAATQRQTAAETKLADAKEKVAGQADKGKGGVDASSLGQSLFSGVLQSIGLDGSVFSDFTQWPNFKSGMALANFGGGLLKKFLGGGKDDTDSDSGTDSGGDGGFGGGALSSIGLDNLTGLIKPNAPGTQTPIQNLPDAPHPGTGAAPGPTFQINGNVGMDPKAVTDKFTHTQNQAWRKSGMNAVRPG